MKHGLTQKRKITWIQKTARGYERSYPEHTTTACENKTCKQCTERLENECVKDPSTLTNVQNFLYFCYLTILC